MGKLFIVASPIGNLGDITFRAIEILKDVSFVICEDTRRTALLLNKYKIKKELISYHQHSQLTKIDWIIGRLKEGESAALVSDAGTPGIADPGGKVVEAAVADNITVVPIPGPSAITALLSVIGQSADEFVFLGYLPKKKGRETLIKSLIDEKRGIVIYESPERIERTLHDLEKVFPKDAKVVVGREMTKVFEEFIRGNLGEIINQLPKIKKKGEFVLWIRNI